MFDPGPLRPPWLVLEALGTGAILTEIATILASHSQTVRKDRAALLADKCLGRGIQYFLVQMASGVDPVPGLERVTLVRVEPDKMVHIMHLLFSVRVDFYLTRRCLFACLGDLPAEPSPPPGGGDSPQGLRGAALYSLRAASGTCDPPRGDLPSRLADEAMREGSEDGGDRVI